MKKPTQKEISKEIDEMFLDIIKTQEEVEKARIEAQKPTGILGWLGLRTCTGVW
tara:strand:- start:323 stop:484 length:162 start_codon:yes stop_codon:yes gene_type:complete